MNFDLFYERCQQLPENDKKWADAFCSTVSEVFGGDEPNFEDLGLICRLFYGKGNSVSKAQYYRKKKFVHLFYKWLYDQGAVRQETLDRVFSLRLGDVITDHELSHYYFKNLDGALDFVRTVGRSKGFEDYDDLLNIKTIVILSWHQVDLNELQKIRKSDLQLETHTVLVGEKQIQLTIEHFNILKRFAEIDIHKGFPSQKQQVYMPSPFLMRSARQTSLNPNNIHQAIQRFNSVTAEHDQKLSILNLRRNGIFSQVYAAGDEKAAGALIQKLTGCDTAFACGYKEFYERWKQLMVGGEVGEKH